MAKSSSVSESKINGAHPKNAMSEGAERETEEAKLSSTLGTQSRANRTRGKKKRKRSVIKTAVSGVGQATSNESASARGKFPKHSVEKALRVPGLILSQNAGKPCTDKEAAAFAGLGSPSGLFGVEISSAIKYGFLERPKKGTLAVTQLARKAIRPQEPDDKLSALREAILKAPDISEVYANYRGENLPDREFLENAIRDKFAIPTDKIADFISVFHESLTSAKLIEDHDGKQRVLDVSKDGESLVKTAGTVTPVAQRAGAATGDSCFVMMPFAPPIGSYYSLVYEPAIRKAGLVPIRADTDIFGTGKIMDQIWQGIAAAKVLVAELTTKNPNVFYELGLAHSLKKPVVLVSSNDKDVPFDLQHIRVIYYDVTDPFWGTKLLDKVAENIVSAIQNPEEAVFKGNVAMAAK